MECVSHDLVASTSAILEGILDKWDIKKISESKKSSVDSQAQLQRMREYIKGSRTLGDKPAPSSSSSSGVKGASTGVKRVPAPKLNRKVLACNVANCKLMYLCMFVCLCSCIISCMCVSACMRTCMYVCTHAST